MNLKNHMDKNQEREFEKLMIKLITEMRLLKNELVKYNKSHK